MLLVVHHDHKSLILMIMDVFPLDGYESIRLDLIHPPSSTIQMDNSNHNYGFAFLFPSNISTFTLAHQGHHHCSLS